MPPLHRRDFLKAIALSAAAATMPAGHVLAAMAADAIRVSRTRFPQSVASGDPRPDGVVLWTRLASADADGAVPAPVSLHVQVADDPAFTVLRVDRPVALPADSDGCLKLRLDGLQPGRTYHYRFLLADADGFLSSPPGRTRTAPAVDADAPVRFAFVSCQDFGGRWYNSLVPLLQEDLDFVLHLGDFIYETVGDPGFQDGGDAARRVAFEDADGAIVLGAGAAGFHAARSLSNYRQLHRTFRGDAMLQALLERTPLVAIWDDHEFSDDCWQDVATYRDGRIDERDNERRRNAEQAYFEYMPVDVGVVAHADGEGALPVDRARLHPNLGLWRELRFGRGLQLLLTDYRSARGDHAIPEDAFPGAVVYDSAALAARLPRLGLDPAQVAPLPMPYVDLAEPRHAPLRAAARAAIAAAYEAEGEAPAAAESRAADATAGAIALPVLARFLDGWNAGVDADAKRVPPPAEGLPRGLSWMALGKTTLFGSTGSRYMVLKDSYDLLAALRALDGAAGALGAAQHAWLAGRMAAAHDGFRLVASPVSFTSLVLDLREPALGAPGPLRHRFYLNVDHWDGFPVERRQLMADVFDRAGGVVVLSGDIHAGLATQHSPSTVEFTAPAVSSETLHGMIARSIAGDPSLGDAAHGLLANLDALFAAGFPPLKYVQSARHGVGVVAIDGGRATVDFLELPAELCRQRLYDQPGAIRAQLQRRRFTVDRATMRLEPQGVDADTGVRG